MPNKYSHHSTVSSERYISEKKVRISKRFYHIIGEGFTETQYFRNLNRLLQEEQAPVNLTIVNKLQCDWGKTNPSELYNLIADMLEIRANGVLPIEMIAKYLDSWAHEINLVPRKDNEFQHCLLDACAENSLTEPISIESFIRNRCNYESLLYTIMKQGLIKSMYGRKQARKGSWYMDDYRISTFIDTLIENHGMDKKIDCVCMIYDRDQYPSKDYQTVLKQIEINNYLFSDKKIKTCVTNPCFEFWLLMHIDAAMNNFDAEKMLKNPKSYPSKNGSENIRYSEYVLEQHIRDYGKNNIDALFSRIFAPNIDTAIRNEKQFCEEITLLENTIGSNIGKLIEEFRDPSLWDGENETTEKRKVQLGCLPD